MKGLKFKQLCLVKSPNPVGANLRNCFTAIHGPFLLLDRVKTYSGLRKGRGLLSPW